MYLEIAQKMQRGKGKDCIQGDVKLQVLFLTLGNGPVFLSFSTLSTESHICLWFPHGHKILFWGTRQAILSFVTRQ